MSHMLRMARLRKSHTNLTCLNTPEPGSDQGVTDVACVSTQVTATSASMEGKNPELLLQSTVGKSITDIPY